MFLFVLEGIILGLYLAVFLSLAELFNSDADISVTEDIGVIFRAAAVHNAPHGIGRSENLTVITGSLITLTSINSRLIIITYFGLFPLR